MSYEQSHNLLQEIGQTYTNQMSAAMKEGKRLCLVGDNVNYAVGIREQRKENCGKTKLLHHAFASVALLNDSKFDHLSKIKPQRPWTDLKLDDFIVNEEEYKNIRLDYTKHIVKAAIKHVPFFKILDDVFDESSKINEEQYRKNLVIPLETVLKNEQYYADVVDIMEQHENIIEKTFQDAGVTLTDKTKIHTGDDHLSQPTKNIPPEFTTKEEKKQWTVDTFGKMVDEFVWPKHKPKNPVVDKSVVVDGQFMNLKVRLANGKEVQISPRLPEKNKETPPETDKVMNYGQMVLELGLLFKELLDVCKSPDQKKLLRLLKHSMTVSKQNQTIASMLFEIHRFLIQQISTLSEKEAAEVVQGMFVNTTGKPDGHIPADLQMEYVVKTIKNILNICVRDIAEHFDSISGVIVRSKKHKHKDAAGDELMMIGDLRKLRPFKFEAGRYHSAFPDINKSAVDNLPRTDYHTWITTRIVTNANDLGD
ncbi:unnamed protein product [Mytilus edulis]|uniref:DUF6589 domain-containing protein n=1 Tax=Mytilus edulis TaxID=6550 RepID=A0A8S3QAD0_MYTED|nr:unnamed protein product [Mytilus edulis]